MKLKLGVLGGAAAIGIAVLVAMSAERPSAMPLSRTALAAPTASSSETLPQTPARKSMAIFRGERSGASPTAPTAFRSAPTSEIRDEVAVELMGRPAESELPALRLEFLESKDPEHRMRLLHVLLAQQSRFGFPLQVEGQARDFLRETLDDPERAELHGAAIAALGRWGSRESLAMLGGVLSTPPSPKAFAQAVETLGEARSPEAGSVAKEFFRSSSDFSQRLAAANLLLRMSKQAPELGLDAMLRQEVRPILEQSLALAPNGWIRKAAERTLNEIP